MSQWFAPFRLIFYTLVHPFNGFWEAKYETPVRLRTALILFVLFSLTMIFRGQYTGFLVNFNNPNDFNSLNELLYIIFPFLLWCISNWLVTTLLDGEGTFKEIIIVTCMSLLPIILVNVPATIFSRFITQEEAAFYHVFHTVGIIWFLFLMFVGFMTIHQYSIRKTIMTALMSLIVIGIILFVALLVFSLIQQIVMFIMTLYYEVSFRM